MEHNLERLREYLKSNRGFFDRLPVDEGVSLMMSRIYTTGGDTTFLICDHYKGDLQKVVREEIERIILEL